MTDGYCVLRAVVVVVEVGMVACYGVGIDPLSEGSYGRVTGWDWRWRVRSAPQHVDRQGSTCYDLLWRLTLTRDATHNLWRVNSLTASLQGFRGRADGPCLEGLTPYT